MDGDYAKSAYPNPDAILFPKMIPYRGAVPGGLHDGKLVEIRGTVPYGSDVFTVNFLTGFDTSADRTLHISVRLSERCAVRNAFQRGAWGAEERTGPFPFASGREFTMMIASDSDAYRIAVNNQHCWQFHHRMPMARVSSILIDGAVEIERIQFIDKISPAICVPTPSIVYPSHHLYPGRIPYQPGVCIPTPSVVYPSRRISPGIVTPGICPIPAVTVVDPGFYPGAGINTGIIAPPEQICPQPGYIPGGSSLAPVYNPSIPYAYPIYGGLKPGMMVYISGRPSASAQKFTLNFQSGTSPYPPPDIAFHFDARFYNRSIVRNSRTNNVWEREETIVSHFPFQHGVNFDMIIRVEAQRYMIALNGQHFLEFRHRLHPLARFDTLYIENDIVVSSIRFA